VLIGHRESERGDPVVVTGMGVVSPVGVGLDAFWSALVSGRSGIGPLTLFDVTNYPTRIAAEVKPDFDPEAFVEDPKALKLMGRNSQFAVAAGRMAIQDSGLAPGQYAPARCGVSMGASRGYLAGSFSELLKGSRLLEDPALRGRLNVPAYIGGALKRLHPLDFVASLPNMPAAHLAQLANARGINRTILTTCAAGTQAIGDAARIIQRGDADVMLAGGSDSMIHPLGMLGFNFLEALSTNNAAGPRACRPFDARRDGFVMGEGAGILVLESLRHARDRGARIYGEILGFGATSDAYRLTEEPPDGRGAVAAMEQALADARLAPGHVDYINAHGTSTPLNDKVETAVVRRIFGDAARGIPVSSTKSMTGHLMAAAGAVEAIVCLLAIKHGIVPPTINYEEPDPECDLDYVPNHARSHSVRAAMSNSFGFGGQCAVLIVGEQREDDPCD
jgi:3-oxoacyl-[acyl-carrier-protein] synthase II